MFVERNPGIGSRSLEWQAVPTYNLNGRQVNDLELIMNGGFAPLVGFMNSVDYRSVLDTMRLANGRLFPLPVVLDIPREVQQVFSKNGKVTLCDGTGIPLAVLTVEDLYEPDRLDEARAVFDTSDQSHFGVQRLLERTHPLYVGGKVEMVQLPRYYEHTEYRVAPVDLKRHFDELGWDKVIGFQTRNPIHRAHFELLSRAARDHDAKVLIHPAVGETRDGDIDAATRIRTYKSILATHAKDFAVLNLLPLAMRMAGPREAVLHALIRKNYGCTHFIVGRDHAGPGKNAVGKPFYPPYAAQEMARRHADELGITIVAPKEMVYVEELNRYEESHKVAHHHTTRTISGTKFRTMLNEGKDIPEWFSFPEVVAILRRAVMPQGTRGFTVFFTGLSGSGKSTLAAMVQAALQEQTAAPVSLLDGDIVRQHLSKGLTFSKEDRDTNIRRIGFVASEVTKHGGITLCAAIAPFAQARREARALVEQYGEFVEVYVATPLEICEERDVKGLYTKARQGIIQGFTGIESPYETPKCANVTIDTSTCSVDEAVQTIIAYLRDRSLII